MTQKSLTTWALASLMAIGSAASALAQDSNALIDALVRKKVLTAQEAEDVRADLIRENTLTNAGKLQLSNSITSLKLYGDMRLRYQYDNRDPQVLGADDDQQRSRFRTRIRLNGDFTLAGGFFGGVQLQTSQAADSSNQTLGDSSSGASGFSNYSIYLSRAFVGWGNDWLTAIGGKQANPFYTTDLVWDSDINPDGFSEKIDLLKAFDALAGNDSDIRGEGRYGLSLAAGQFILCDNDENAASAIGKTDAWLFGTQLIASAKITPNVKVTVAPGYMFYTAGNVTNTVVGGTNNKFNETPYYGINATRDLSIVTAPGDVSFKLCGLKTKVLWDVAYNTKGGDRTKNIYGITSHSSSDDLAWLAGIQVGENKKAGDWSILANFRQTGLSAVDPNLNDSDFALGQLNMQGIKTGLAYNFTDFCVGALTYFDAWNLRNVTGGDATSGQKIANMNSVRIFQADLSIKF